MYAIVFIHCNPPYRAEQGPFRKLPVLKTFVTLVNANLVYVNFTTTTFLKVPIPNIWHTYCNICSNTRLGSLLLNLVNTKFSNCN